MLDEEKSPSTLNTKDAQSDVQADALSQPAQNQDSSDHDSARSRSHSPSAQKQIAPPPPLPKEALPSQPPDDGWEALWDEQAQAFYFYNRVTNVTQWENPRVPTAAQPTPANRADKVDESAGTPEHNPRQRVGGYDPSIHGDYDPNADYAKAYETLPQDGTYHGTDPSINASGAEAYAATGSFNRFTGKWQRAELNPENFSDEQKSRRQMNAFFDVDAAANTHDGRSLRAERASKKLSKAELKAFKEKRREKKEEKRRAWLRD